MILTILLVVLGIALVVVFLNRQKDEEKARLGILGLTAAIVVLTIIRLIGTGGGASEFTYDVTPDSAIGESTAGRIAQAAKGKRVVVVAHETTTNPFAAARLEGFRRGLLEHGMELLAVESPWPQSLIEAGERFPDEGLDARGVEEAMRKHPDAEVVVSLVGFPVHNFQRVARQLERVEFFVFDEYSAYEWQDHVARGVVDGIILQPLDADWSDAVGSGDELFDRRYVFVTRQNLAQMRHRFEDLNNW